MGRFDEKVALVTGAASGIGKAIALAFAAEGAKVACFDLAEEGLAQTVSDIESLGAEAFGQLCDVADEGDVDAAVAATNTNFGGIDVVNNVAGIGGFRAFSELDYTSWRKYMGVNLDGTYLFCHKALPTLIERKGNIVNIGSLSGLKGQPYSAHYCASKGAVHQLTKALAHEYGQQGVRVNAIAPGGIDTPIITEFTSSLPEGADPMFMIKLSSILPTVGAPAEIAKAALFLADNDMGGYITGAILSVDGGAAA